MTYWHLYWVMSDSVEDCFVVARNSRSACRIEMEMNGFDQEEVTAERIMRIPYAVEEKYKDTSIFKEHGWPWYVFGKEFFTNMGAEFRELDGNTEMLLDEYVYTVEDFRPCSIFREYSVGYRAINEIENDEELSSLENVDEDIWHAPEIHLITMIGICLIRCHQIENYISNSFLLGVSKKQKKKYRTINELVDGWKRKTLGGMIASIEEAYRIEENLRKAIRIFVYSRNLLVHGITTSERYNINTHWGQLELLGFLKFFDVQSRIVKFAFRSSFFASIEFGNKFLLNDSTAPVELLSQSELDEATIFAHFFEPKPDCI